MYASNKASSRTVTSATAFTAAIALFGVSISVQAGALDLELEEAGQNAVAAQSGATAPAPAEAISEVVVTASRLTTAGFNAPTPTEVVGVEEIHQLAEPNLGTAVGELPALSGDLGTTTGNGGTSSGNNGLTNLNLRFLGENRTLVLIDGQRVAPAFIDGSTDVSLFPQLLVQRVDVVTGGASASYGSDAVAGVVNFVTNTHFTGFEANVMGGISGYSDDRQGLVQLAWGTTALDNRFHIEASGEYYDNLGVPARNPGDNGGADGRTWYKTPILFSRTPASTPAGQADEFLFTPTQLITEGANGLITSGPLMGTAFGPGGTPYQFTYGSPCIGSDCLGGEMSNDNQMTNTLDAAIRRGVLYTRLAYDLTPQLELFASISYAGVRTFDQPNAGANEQANLTIQCSNPYVPASIQAACVTDKITSFPLGTANMDFPQYIQIQTNRTQPRYVLGLNGTELNIFGKPWTLQAYGEYGQTNEDININNMILLPRYQAAQTATLSANGQIVCSATAAQAPGCVPFDILGANTINPAAWSYMAPAYGPAVQTVQWEKAGSVALSGAPLQNWAGPVSVAVGGEWREEYYQATGDPYGNGASAQSPYDAAYPADPVLSTSGNNWYAGNFHDGHGLYNVREGFAELGMPLFNNHYLGKFDADAAGRETHYSTAGSVFTWKLGGVWDTPLDGVRLRVVRSQDIRAPNLQDLYAPATTLSNAGITNHLANGGKGASVTVLQTTVGNPNLVPEIAQNLEAGIVLQPDWLRGFRASFDYYSIKVTGAVVTLTSQQEVDGCQISGIQADCALVNFVATGSAGLSNTITLIPFNAATITLDGFDMAAAYQFDLARMGLPGSFSLTGQTTHPRKWLENTGVPGQPLINNAGSNVGSVPNWKGLVTESWTGKTVGFTLIQRFITAGTVGATFIQCNPGTCPVATTQNPTIYDNHLPGALYWDISGTYNIPHGQVYVKVNNTFNKSPPPDGSVTLYDVIGRVYRLGVRFNL